MNYNTHRHFLIEWLVVVELCFDVFYFVGLILKLIKSIMNDTVFESKALNLVISIILPRLCSVADGKLGRTELKSNT